MITFVGGSKFAKGGPNPLANMDSRGSISASGFRPGGPNPGGSKSARTPEQKKNVSKRAFQQNFDKRTAFSFHIKTKN